MKLTVILNFIGVKMTMNCDYDSVVGVILPVENKILLIVHAVFLLVVKMAATLNLFLKFWLNLHVKLYSEEF